MSERRRHPADLTLPEEVAMLRGRIAELEVELGDVTLKRDILSIIRHDPDEVRDFIQFSRCFSFSGFDAKLLISPLVYVLLRGIQPLYVGMSSRGAQRPFNADHHVLRDMQDGDKLLLWPVKNTAMAERMERALIAQLKPTLNQRHVTREACDALGVARLRTEPAR